MKNSIRLDRTTRGWMATSEGPYASDIIELFGTAVLPTAFKAMASADEVLGAIAKLNPGIYVYLGYLGEG